MTQDAENLFAKAKEYASSFEKFRQDMDGPAGPFIATQSMEAIMEAFHEHERLKIHFLFPNAKDDVRALFTKLGFFRKGVQSSRNRPEGNKEIRRLFAETSAQIEEILEDLLPVQVEIMREKYLSNVDILDD